MSSAKMWPGARRQLRFGSANVLGQYEQVAKTSRVDGWHVRLEYTVLQRRRRLNEPNGPSQRSPWLNRLKRLIPIEPDRLSAGIS